MAANALRLRRSLALTSSILNQSKHFSSVIPSVAPTSTLSTIQQNPSTFDVNQSKPRGLSSQFISSRAISSRVRLINDNPDRDQISEDAILFEGCDYNHWLITMDFPKDPKPSPEEMVETYVQTAAKVLGSVEEAKKKIYACSTTTYNGFQVEVSEEVSEQFKVIPGVVFVLPDSYIDPVNKEYGGDKYINGTIIPRPPPVQYGRQGGRYNDRNREYNRPSRGSMEQNGPPGGQGNNYQGDRRPSYQSNYNQGDGRNVNPPRQTDFPQRDQGNFAPPPPVGGYNQGGGGSYRQGTEGQYGQGAGGGSGGGYGGQYRQGGSGGGGYGGQYGQGGGGGGGHYGQGGGGGGQYGQGGGGGGQYGQGGGGGGQYGQGGGGGGQYGQGGGGGGEYGHGGGGGGSYVQGGGGQYGQGVGGNYGQGGGGGYGQGYGSGSGRSAPQYGENTRFPGQQRNYEAVEETEAFNER